MLALAEAQVTLAREEAQAGAQAAGKGKGRKVETEDTVMIEAAVEVAAVTRQPQRQRKNVRLYSDLQTQDKYVNMVVSRKVSLLLFQQHGIEKYEF